MCLPDTHLFPQLLEFWVTDCSQLSQPWGAVSLKAPPLPRRSPHQIINWSMWCIKAWFSDLNSWWLRRVTPAPELPMELPKAFVATIIHCSSSALFLLTDTALLTHSQAVMESIHSVLPAGPSWTLILFTEEPNLSQLVWERTLKKWAVKWNSGTWWSVGQMTIKTPSVVEFLR